MKKPYIKKGSILTIKVILYQGSKTAQPEQNITGLCIKKKNKGFDSSFVLSHVLTNESIIQKFPLYSPFLHFVGRDHM